MASPTTTEPLPPLDEPRDPAAAPGYFTILGGKYLNDYERVTPKVPPGWSEFHATRAATTGIRCGATVAASGMAQGGTTTRRTSRQGRSSVPSPRPEGPAGLHLGRAVRQPYTDRPRRPSPRRSALRRNPSWDPPGYMEADVSDKPAYVRRQRLRARDGMRFGPICRALLSADDLLRKVTATLREQGRLDRTLFILTSDNGMNDGMHRWLRDKKTPYATQLPFFVSWPARIDAGARTGDGETPEHRPGADPLRAGRLPHGALPDRTAATPRKSFLGLLLGTGGAPRRPAVLSSFRTKGAVVPRWYGVDTTRLRHSRTRLRAGVRARLSLVLRALRDRRA